MLKTPFPRSGKPRTPLQYGASGAMLRGRRILLPANLREFAGIEKDVVSVGVYSRVEIWSKERYEENTDFDDMDEIAEHMAELGIGI